MLRRSTQSQERLLELIGLATVVAVALVALLVITRPFGGSGDRISVVVEAPYVGEGVKAGSAVVLHGVEVGRVTNTVLQADGDVRIDMALQKEPASGLTDAMAIDYRPVNYFGVAGINLIPKEGGSPLRDGTEISLVPRGNFTLTRLLSQLGDVSAGALTPNLINVVDRVSRYTDGLTPLFETMVTATTAVADVQTVSTAHLLANTTDIAEKYPAFGNALIDAAVRPHKFDYYPERGSAPIEAASAGPKLYYPFVDHIQTPSLSDEPEDYFWSTYKPFLDLASTGLFAAVGRLEVSHVDNLLPLVDGIKTITDVAPRLIRPEKFAANLVELRKRLEKLYGGNGQQRALQVRILLDSFPAVAAPLGIVTSASVDGPAPPATAEATSDPAPADSTSEEAQQTPPVDDNGSP